MPEIRFIVSMSDKEDDEYQLARFAKYSRFSTICMKSNHGTCYE
jgi:hypothetical protein